MHQQGPPEPRVKVPSSNSIEMGNSPKIPKSSSNTSPPFTIKMHATLKEGRKLRNSWDFEYRNPGIQVRPPAAQNLDRRAKCATEVSRATECRSSSESSHKEYDPYPFATVSEDSEPRGIMKCRKGSPTAKAPDSPKEKYIVKFESDVSSRQKTSWSTRLTQQIKSFTWNKRGGERIWDHSPLSSNEGSLHKFPASFTTERLKGQHPYMNPGKALSMGSSDGDIACRNQEHKSARKEDINCLEDCELEGEITPGQRLERENAKEPPNIARLACVDNKSSTRKKQPLLPGTEELCPRHERVRARKSEVSDAVQRRRVARGERAKGARTDRHLNEKRKQAWGQ